MMNTNIIKFLGTAILLSLTFFSAVAIDNRQIAGINYGLHFNTGVMSGVESTQLDLNNGDPVAFNKELKIEFRMMLRPNNYPFGSVTHIALDNGTVVKMLFSPDENEKLHPTLVYNDALTLLSTDNLHAGEWVDVSISLLPAINNIKIKYADTDTTMVVPMNGAKSAGILFGRTFGDIVPMNLRDVRVSVDGKNKFFWKLGRHNNNVCLDSLNAAPAVAINPKWLIDSHREWNLIFQKTFKGDLDIAFDPATATTYIIGDKGSEIIDANGRVKDAMPIGRRNGIAITPGHSVFDPITKNIVLYSLASGVSNRISSDRFEWLSDNVITSDALHFNHARAYNPADSSFYFFGGYGHFAFRNDLYRLSSSGEIEKINYSNPIPPRCGAAMAVEGDKIYILGGRGNESGKQAIDSHPYHDFWEIDLRSRKARKLWERHEDDHTSAWMMASSMIALPGEKGFFALDMNKNGGTLLHHSIDGSLFYDASRPIKDVSAFQDFDFSLYYSPQKEKMFMMIHKISSDKKHIVSVYTIDTPLSPEDDLAQDAKNPTSRKIWPWILIGCVLAAAFGFAIYLMRRKPKDISTLCPNDIEDKEQVELGTVPPTDSVEALLAENEDSDNEKENMPDVEPAKKYYDTSSKCIVLIGGFCVRDKEGADITDMFTPKLKEFLLLLILSSTSDRGVPVAKVTEEIWNDREGISSRNTRNVTVRRLRMLLESIGNVELINHGGFMKLNIPDDVYCDYYELHRCSKALHTGDIPEKQLNERILEILLGGQLLPNSNYLWLNDFKASYSSLAIDLLSNLLQNSMSEHDDDMSLRISKVMFIQDTLSEKALSIYCRILVEQGKRGIAKKFYDVFCREYESYMGEPFRASFSDVLNGTFE